MAANDNLHGLWGFPQLLMTKKSIIRSKKERPLTMEMARQVSEGEPCLALLIEIRRWEWEQYVPLVELVQNRPEGLEHIAWFMTHADQGEHRTIILHDQLDSTYNRGTLTELMTRYLLDCLDIEPGVFPNQWIEKSIPVTNWLEEEIHANMRSWQ